MARFQEVTQPVAPVTEASLAYLPLLLCWHRPHVNLWSVFASMGLPMYKQSCFLGSWLLW